MKILDSVPGYFLSYMDGEVLTLVRHREISRSEMVTTDKELLSGNWIATLLEEVGDTLVERYQKFHQ